MRNQRDRPFNVDLLELAAGSIVAVTELFQLFSTLLILDLNIT